ncbi:MAG: S8 family serine peptidase [Actinobacteria bacterium]|nr:S8 family serine peptidase [Actinomycetota bacterium]
MTLAAALVFAVALSGSVLGAAGQTPTAEVIVTLKAPALSAFGRSLQSASHTAYLARMDASQNVLARRIESAVPDAHVRWRFRLVANGFAVVVPRSQVSKLSEIPGVDRVWPNVRYHALAVKAGPEQIGADKLWGANLETSGQGMKIGIIDDGLQATNPYFDPTGFTYPPGFPKGQTSLTTAKVIVQRTFAPASPSYQYANTPFDPTQSFHATHVAGIAAGDHGTKAGGTTISGVAPNAYLGNYKALTIPTPEFGLDGNSAEIAAAIEAAVADGMNVINLSLGEPEVEPSRDIVVAAINAAAAAGVVPVLAAGNDFTDFGYGSISSPGNAKDAITVAAVSASGVIADFSSAGPTPLSLQLKPDVSAPGLNVLSSLPTKQGSFGVLSGTSMASPHVAGAAALLKQRHPTWTVAEIKSALTQSGDAVRSSAGAEAFVTREGGGLVDLPRADVPLVFVSPTTLSFKQVAAGSSGGTAQVSLADAGGGAGPWSVSVTRQTGSGSVTTPSTVNVPGTLPVTATAGTAPGDVEGFVILTHGTDVRRIPYWFDVTAPKLKGPLGAIVKPGVYSGTTKGAPARVSDYRYPTGGDVTYPGPERAYRVVVTGRPANLGVVVLTGTATPHVVYDGHEDHLAGYAGLPTDLNPYRSSYGRSVRVAGVVLPGVAKYDLVFDTRSAAQSGPFTFRYWINDVAPPRLRLKAIPGAVSIAATDASSGVDPSSVVAVVDGKPAKPTYAPGSFRIRLAKGTHQLVFQVSDYQEDKNMEDVARILPNTAVLRTTVTIR